MDKFEVPRRAKTCSINHEPLLPGTDYYSVLTKEFERCDYCPNCFPGAEKLPEGALGFWKASIPAKKEKPKTRTQRALHLLKETEDLNEAFVLALFLARKKVLKLRQELNEHFLYEVLDTEEMLTVKKVDLSQLEEEKIQQNIAKVLADEPQSA